MHFLFQGLATLLFSFPIPLLLEQTCLIKRRCRQRKDLNIQLYKHIDYISIKIFSNACFLFLKECEVWQPMAHFIAFNGKVLKEL